MQKSDGARFLGKWGSNWPKNRFFDFREKLNHKNVVRNVSKMKEHIVVHEEWRVSTLNVMALCIR